MNMQKRVRKKLGGNKKGFTMTEVILVVAILAVLAAIAIPNIAKMQKDLHMMELDEGAKSIFTAAQSRLSEMRASGELYITGTGVSAKSTLSEKQMTAQPEDFEETATLKWDASSYFVVSSEDAAIFTLLPPSAIESALSGGYFYVEFNAKTGMVYGVFYSDVPFTYNESDFNDKHLRTQKDSRKAYNPVIGYYGGSAIDYTVPEMSERLPFEIVNSDALYVKINATDFNVAKNDASSIAITIADQSGGSYSAELVVNDNLTLVGDSYIFLLDSLETGKQFKDIMPDLVAGENISVTIAVTTGDKLPGKMTKITNSLFASRNDDTTANIHILNERHLQNLDTKFSNFQDVVASVDLDAPISRTVDKFISIHNEDIIGFNGHGNMLKDFNAPIFDILNGSGTARATIKNVKLVDSRVSETLSGTVKNIGLLVNYAQYADVSDCILYSENHKQTYLKSSGANFTGGMIGYAQNCTITKSSASIPTISSTGGSTGGLVGGMTDTAISLCYADTGLWNSAKKEWENNSGLNATSGNTGGLVGNAASGSITNCYATGIIGNTGGKTSYAGGLAGLGKAATYANSYAAITYVKHGTDTTTQGLVGNAAGTTGQSKCYFLKSARTPAVTSQEKTYDQLTALTSTLGTAAWTASGKTVPYGRTGNYPFPTLKGLIHYADWTDSAKYTIVFWLEKENIPIDVFNADPHNVTFYDSICKAPAEGFTGEVIGETISKYLPTDLETKKKMLQVSTAQKTTNGQPYASFEFSSQGEILGDETTVVNVYYSRNIYYMKFSFTGNGDATHRNVLSNIFLNIITKDDGLRTLTSSHKNAMIQAANNGETYSIPGGGTFNYTFPVKEGLDISSFFPRAFSLDENGKDVQNVTNLTTAGNENYVLRGWGPWAISNTLVFLSDHLATGKTYADSYNNTTKTATYNSLWDALSKQKLTKMYTFVESLDQSDSLPYDVTPNVVLDSSGKATTELLTKRFKIDTVKLMKTGGEYKESDISTLFANHTIETGRQYFDYRQETLPYWANAKDRQISPIITGFTHLRYNTKLDTNVFQWGLGNSLEPIFYQLASGGNNRNDSIRYCIYMRNSYKLSVFIDANNAPATKDLVKFEMPLSRYEDELKEICEPYLNGKIIEDFYYDREYTMKVDFTKDTMPANDMMLFPKTIDVAEGLFYYEKYSDGSYGYYSPSGFDTLSDTLPITEDGYAVVILQSFDEANPPTLNITTDLRIPAVSIAEDKSIEGIDFGNGFVAYHLTPNSNALKHAMASEMTSLYATLMFKLDGETYRYYYNPNFAKAVFVDKNNGTPVLPNDTFGLRTARHLSNLSKMTNSNSTAARALWNQQKYLQTRDITMSGDFISLSSAGPGPTHIFAGTYDGGNHTISGITQLKASSATGYAGFFGAIGNNGSSVGSAKNVRLLAGSTSTVVRGNKNSPNAEHPVSGGFVGANTGTIENCFVYGVTVYSSNIAGGFVGANAGTIKNCASNNSAWSLGSITNSSNGHTGGFVGYNTNTIQNCYAIATVHNSAKGGFAGENTATISASYCITKKVNGGYPNFCGGIAGTDCYTYDNKDKTSIHMLRTIANSQWSQVAEIVTTYPMNNTTTATYPYPAVVKNSNGTYVHYGNWPN